MKLIDYNYHEKYLSIDEDIFIYAVELVCLNNKLHRLIWEEFDAHNHILINELNR